MRLLNASTQELEEFADEVPMYWKYAILSHVWIRGEEISFRDMRQGVGGDKSGYAKIVKTCQLARAAGLQYVWVDTCCIDKSSSAELSEAINSMYRWYSNASICFAYLADVPDVRFAQSNWFTRGWTLQELIAPTILQFYDSKWGFMGSKSELLVKIRDITGVDIEVLKHRSKLDSISVAARMSWAARRRTTRVEDRAYSLMGIFNVNMPMLYGEGDKAFLRLQEEIIRTSTDHSILVWATWEDSQAHTLFAPSPYGFRKAGKVLSWSHPDGDESFTLTNKGLRITLPVVSHSDADLISAMLNCRYADKVSTQICLCLGKAEPTKIIPSREFLTTSAVYELAVYQGDDNVPTSLTNLDRLYLPTASWTDLLILREPADTWSQPAARIWTQRITLQNKVPRLKLVEAWPRDEWSESMNEMTKMLTGNSDYDTGGYFKFDERDSTRQRQFVLAFRSEYTPAGAEPRVWLQEHWNLFRNAKDVFRTVSRQEAQKSASLIFQPNQWTLVAEVQRKGVGPTGETNWMISLRLDRIFQEPGAFEEDRFNGITDERSRGAIRGVQAGKLEQSAKLAAMKAMKVDTKRSITAVSADSRQQVEKAETSGNGQLVQDDSAMTLK